MRNLYAAMTFLVTLAICAADGNGAEYAPVPGAFPLTRWAKDVSPENVLPEYPRRTLPRLPRFGAGTVGELNTNAVREDTLP